MASPYLFNLVLWESKYILDKSWHALKHGIQKSEYLEDISPVLKYEELKREISGLKRELNGKSTPLENKENLKARLLALENQREQLQKKVEFILESQTSLILDDEKLTSRFPALSNFSVLFPAVDYVSSSLPNLLVVSPREDIKIIESILLYPDLNPHDMESLEKKVEVKGVSALVEKVGGIAAYPSILSGEVPLPSLLENIAHEWFHQYLFFRPLGRNYRTNYQMTIINETVADIAGKEIAGKVLKRFYSGIIMKEPGPIRPRLDKSKIDFTREMRRIRLKVDELLAQGKVLEAEKFMEESREYLSRNGYFLRRLNQAYFAFHGSYGESPQSTSPIGPRLRQIRNRSFSLADFVRIVSSISSTEQFFDMTSK